MPPSQIGARLTIWTLAAMIVVLIGITPFIKIDRVVSSTAGKIISTQALSTFQALDPSIIKSVDVKEGQQVDKGQLLATLDATFAQADVGQLRQQIAGLDAQIARARAEQDKTALVFPADTSTEALPYRAMQKALYDQRASQYGSAAAILRREDQDHAGYHRQAAGRREPLSAAGADLPAGRGHARHAL